jgi:hypothetical protein
MLLLPVAIAGRTLVIDERLILHSPLVSEHALVVGVLLSSYSSTSTASSPSVPSPSPGKPFSPSLPSLVVPSALAAAEKASPSPGSSSSSRAESTDPVVIHPKQAIIVPSKPSTSGVPCLASLQVIECAP